MVGAGTVLIFSAELLFLRPPFILEATITDSYSSDQISTCAV